MSYNLNKNDRLHMLQQAPEIMQALLAVEAVINNGPLQPTLVHLVKLRISQMNTCEFCVGMHIKEALADGESQTRLDHLVVWRDTNLFSNAERAALAWGEALTANGNQTDLDDLRAQLGEEFSEADVCHLTLVVVMINSWNRIQVASHGAHF